MMGDINPHSQGETNANKAILAMAEMLGGRDRGAI